MRAADQTEEKVTTKDVLLKINGAWYLFPFVTLLENQMLQAACGWNSEPMDDPDLFFRFVFQGGTQEQRDGLRKYLTDNINHYKSLKLD